jgi:hypothetical protein
VLQLKFASVIDGEGAWGDVGSAPLSADRQCALAEVAAAPVGGASQLSRECFFRESVRLTHPHRGMEASRVRAITPASMEELAARVMRPATGSILRDTQQEDRR